MALDFNRERVPCSVARVDVAEPRVVLHREERNVEPCGLGFCGEIGGGVRFGVEHGARRCTYRTASVWPVGARQARGCTDRKVSRAFRLPWPPRARTRAMSLRRRMARRGQKNEKNAPSPAAPAPPPLAASLFAFAKPMLDTMPT